MSIFSSGDAVPLPPHRRTVLDLRPIDPLIVNHSITCMEAATAMAVNKADSVLVVKGGVLVGIVTDKDIMRMVERKLGASATLVEAVMTPNPLTIAPSDSAIEALKLMVEKKFRHLPVVDHSGRVTGLVDISKCLFDAAGRMEKALAASKVLMGDSEVMSLGIDAAQRDFYTEIENRLYKPTVQSVMSSSYTTPSIGFKDTVESAVVAMIKAKASATLIVNGEQDVIGIFTSKDLVLRVVAAGLPFNTTIVRVMTPSPDVVSVNMPIIDAIDVMKKRHFMHLPLADDNNKIVGMVDVIMCSYYVLMHATPSSGSLPKGEKDSEDNLQFWSSAFQLHPDNGTDASSVLSDSVSDSQAFHLRGRTPSMGFDEEDGDNGSEVSSVPSAANTATSKEVAVSVGSVSERGAASVDISMRGSSVEASAAATLLKDSLSHMQEVMMKESMTHMQEVIKLQKELEVAKEELHAVKSRRIVEVGWTALASVALTLSLVAVVSMSSRRN